MKLEATASSDEAPCPPTSDAETSVGAASSTGRARRRPAALRSHQRRLLELFFDREAGSSPPQHRCGHCHEIVASSHHSRNLFAHLRECPRAPAIITALIDRASDDGAPDDMSDAEGDQPAGEATSGDLGPAIAPSPPSAQGDATTTSWTADVSRLFFESSLPLQAADAPSFRAFFAKWVPGRALPSSQELRDRVYDDALTAVIDEVNALGSVAMLVDASEWSRSGAITFLLTSTPRERPPLFWAAVQLDAEPPRLQERFDKSVLDVLLDFQAAATDCHVSGILVTSSIRSLGVTLDSDLTRRALYVGPSPANSMATLLRDVAEAIPVLKTLRKSVVTIVRCIDSRGELKQQFRSLQAWFYPNERDRPALPLAVSSHPRTLYASVKGLHANKSVLKQLFPVHSLVEAGTDRPQQRDNELEAATTVVHSKAVWKDMKLALQLLDPVAEALAAVEADGCPLSEIYRRWRWLLRHEAYALPERALPADEDRARKRILTFLRAWGDQFERSAMVAAFILDPVSDTRELGDQELDRATLEAMSFANDVGECSRLRIHSRTFHSALRQLSDAKLAWTAEAHAQSQRMAPRAWWRAHGEQFPLLRRLALRIFSIPTMPSLEACKGVSRAFADVLAANRDELTWEQVHQLTFVQVNRPHRATTA